VPIIIDGGMTMGEGTVKAMDPGSDAVLSQDAMWSLYQ
jgi:thiazole synthase ThiGH ThiG subunit